MSVNQAQAQAMLAALGAASQIVMARHGQHHEQAMLQLRTSALGQMVDALVNRRIDAVQDGFRAVLEGYAEQARHFMAQQAKLTDAGIGVSDPMVRIELNQRSRELDTELGRIRADAQLLYARMTEVVVMIGGTDIGFGSELGDPLGLPMHRVRH